MIRETSTCPAPCFDIPCLNLTSMYLCTEERVGLEGKARVLKLVKHSLYCFIREQIIKINLYSL